MPIASNRRRATIGPAVLLIASTLAHAGDWPCWRGPHRNGISDDPALPVRWGKQADGSVANVRWKVALPGRGHSSPIVFGDAVFVTACLESEAKRVLLRVDRDSGSVRWQRTVLVAPLEPIHRLNSYASSTPATDGERVYVAFLDRAEMVVVAFDFAGNRVWESRPGPFASKHGFCTCPVIHRDVVIVNGDHDGDAFLAALRRSDGSTIWKTPREMRTRSYGTPIVLEIGGREQIMLAGNYCTAGYDLETGKKIWTCDGPSEQMVATLVHRGELIFSLGGYPERHLLAIRKGGVGDITKSHVVWRTNKGIPYVPSPLLYGDLLHVVSDEGTYTCFEPQSGNVLTKNRVATHVSSSIVGGNGHLYVTDDAGATTVLANEPGFRVIAKNLLEEDVYSTPALASGSVFIRGAKNLYRLGGN